ncbi:MAG: DUF6809 family protein [Oscillospiraceae bacterium]
MSILSELYRSEVPLDSAYWEKRSQNSRLSQDTDKLAKEIKGGMDEKQRELFEEYCQNMSQLTINAEEAAFESGFCIGVKIISEVFNYRPQY